ncbi:MAG: hypothetical protein HY895_02595 [Deltaproteobacteria bacterium]|nr:hypothetical protein [Deltaproteobacteria bacterium]
MQKAIIVETLFKKNPIGRPLPYFIIGNWDQNFSRPPQGGGLLVCKIDIQGHPAAGGSQCGWKGFGKKKNKGLGLALSIPNLHQLLLDRLNQQGVNINEASALLRDLSKNHAINSLDGT